MRVLDYMEQHGHEQLSVWTDPAVGLRAFIAIHDTTLGPSLGGVRIWPYANEEETVLDVLRLSRAMTYKSAVAGLDLGGGKSVIMADSRTDKTEGMFRSFGRFVESLGGRYIATSVRFHAQQQSARLAIFANDLHCETAAIRTFRVVCVRRRES